MAKRWLQFDRNWSWSPPERNGRTMIDYEAGETYASPPMRAAAADAALAAGAAREVKRPSASQATDTASSDVPSEP